MQALLLDAPAPAVTTPAPSTTLPAPRGTVRPTAPSFGAMLSAARTDDDWSVFGQMAIGQLLKLVMILELLGARIPTELIRILRANGMASMADTLEARNRRIDEDGEQGRDKLKRALDLLASRAAA
jgi:hypothetical protein